MNEINDITKPNLLDFDREGMRAFFAKLGEPTYRGDQLINWLHQRRCYDITEMTNLSKSLRERLQNETRLYLPTITFEHKSTDGTIKWLMELASGQKVETVFIPEKTRGTLCVSSQVGCTLNCSFCSTGKMGFSRNLTTAEIIGQVHLAIGAGCNVTNVVMMGMGEPLYNFDSVVGAMNLMLDDQAYGLSKYRVTLSTSGVVPAMEKLRELSPVSLAVSLHAPNDELRNELVPLNKKYPLKELMRVCREYFSTEKKREVMFEYVMLEGINDQPEHARELAKLLRGVRCKINLIPFNPFPLTEYECSDDAQIEAFQKQLMDAGYITLVRRTRGDDVDAACGQLVGQFKDKTKRHARWLRKKVEVAKAA